MARAASGSGEKEEKGRKEGREGKGEELRPLTGAAPQGRVLQLPLPPVQFLRLPVQFLLPFQQLGRGCRSRGLRESYGARFPSPSFPPSPPPRPPVPYLRPVGAVVPRLGWARSPRGLRGSRRRLRRSFGRSAVRRRRLRTEREGSGERPGSTGRTGKRPRSAGALSSIRARSSPRCSRRDYRRPAPRCRGRAGAAPRRGPARDAAGARTGNRY